MNVHAPQTKLSWYSRAVREIETTVTRQHRTNGSPVVTKQRLERLHQTLDRLESGTFGQCSSCNAPIEPERLDADLATTLCSRCAQLRTI